VAHAYNPSYSGGRDQEDRGLGSSARPYLEKPFAKIGLVEWLKVKTLSSSPNTAKKKKKKSPSKQCNSIRGARTKGVLTLR
jgi:hypothetical protein